MKKILAVSGGIDSVVMLHYFSNDPEVIVAHFNHGIRSNSSDDQTFVANLAKKYKLPFVTKDARLGSSASEAEAREARYEFLKSICKKEKGKLFVAHHRDDVLESVAINVMRGTGWRGLAPFNDPEIERPLLDWKKRDIYIYATKNKLSFRQDQTNTEDLYLRNRVREKLTFTTEDQKQQLFDLYKKQSSLYLEINHLLAQITATSKQYISRDIFTQIDDNVSLEILRELLKNEDISQTRPQLLRALEAIKTYQSGKQFPLGKNAYIKISKYNFSIKKAKA